MPSTHYKVVFSGQIAEGFSEVQVKQNLQRIFNIDEQRADGLFVHPNTVIRSGLSLDHAEKYRDRLTQAGMRVAVHAEEAGPAQAEPEPANADRTSAPATAAVDTPPADREPADADSRGRMAQVEFTGSGKEYFGIWIVNILLTILTLGLYSPWATVRNNRYFYGNTRLDGSSFQYLADPWVIFKGRLIAAAVVILWVLVSELWMEAALGLSIGFLFLLPWIITRSLKFNAVNSAYRNIRFDFEGGYWQAFLVLLVWPFVGMITFFLAMPFSIFKSQQFVIENSRFGTTAFTFNTTAGQYYLFFLKVLGVGLGFALVSLGVGRIVDPMLAIPVAVFGYLTLLGYFLAALTNLVMNALGLAGHGFESSLGKRQMVWIYLSNSLLIGLTLGLFTPWAKVRMARYRASCTRMRIQSDLDQFLAAEHTRTSALGQEMGDAFDVGFAPI